MKCKVIKCSGLNNFGNDRYYHKVTLEAENGVIGTIADEDYIDAGRVFNLPDEQWSIDTEDFRMKCDNCGFEYTKRWIRGSKFCCPVCGAEDMVDE